MQAALKGAEQIGFTIISLTFSLIAVLIPLLFMGDVVGRLFREFAITLAVSILISAVVSLTLTPMMCARLLHHTPPEQQGRFYRASGAFFDRVIARYGVWLNWVLDRQGATLMVAIGTLVLTVLLYIFVPKGFFPVQDTGVIQAITEAPQSISFAAMAERQQAVAEYGAGRSGGGKPVLVHRRRRRQRHAQQRPHADQPETQGRARRRCKRRDPPPAGAARQTGRHHHLYAAGAGSHHRGPRQPHPIPVQPAGRQSGRTRRCGCRNWWRRLRSVPELLDVASDTQDQGLQAYVDIDRASAGRLGITTAADR